MLRCIIYRTLAAALTVTAFGASHADATILQYTISGYDALANGEVEFASFRIDSNLVPDGFASGIGFYFAAVPGTYTYGSTTTTVPQDISFYLDAAHGYDDRTTNPGGLFVGEGDLLVFNGPQLFSGPINKPNLLTGEFTLTDDISGSPISLTVAAVPEPATWAMMIIGFGVVGGAMRRKRVTTCVSWAA